MNESNSILAQLSQPGKRSIAVLIDPEKCTDDKALKSLLEKSAFAKIDFLFIGGSTVTRKEFDKAINLIRNLTKIPLVIFPGSAQQISSKADAILYLSLLSGRNPDFLIGHHIQSATELYEMDIEVIPTAYLLIDGGTQSSVAYVSQTTPIPRNQKSIVKQTAIAGKLMGKSLIYLDAGSGAKFNVPATMIKELTFLNVPIIVGGGIRDTNTIRNLHDAGANVVVIGNKIEDEIDFLLDINNYKSNLCS
ncbi:MAG: geranylgeranylglyceryl/heptaprenylglyceryl phosphate synthase [Crocinitomicaceae bacterium]|nr:geranylgeranylglyceryl/heptaprenylglyceryl phosphate synthase [Crocinitomicaceae bacterium]